MSAQPAVTVRSLQLRGDALHREPLLASLDDLAWPAADDGTYLLLRRLRVRAPWWQAAESAGQGARTLAASAVSGWSPGAADAEAVRFADLADLLACLSHDLARGRAAALWYWQAWSHLTPLPHAESVTRLWTEHALLLPELVARLAAQDRLATVCEPLGARDIARVLDAVRQATGWPLPAVERDASPVAVPDVGLPEPQLAHWRPLLARMPHAADPWLPLIAATSGWAQLPHRMHEPATWLAWQRAVGQRLAETRPATAASPGSQAPRYAAATAPDITSPDTPAAEPHAAEPVAPRESVDPHTPTDHRSAARAARPEVDTADTAPPPPSTGTEPPTPQSELSAASAPELRAPIPPADRGAPAPEAPQPAREQTAGAPAATDRPPAATSEPAPPDTPTMAPEPPAADAPEPAHFHTEQGGLFYLLNVLAHPAIAPLMADAPEPGWQRLYRLGLHLGLACDPALARFIAHQLALDHPAALTGLPPLRDEAVLCRLADRQFGHLPEWGPTLLAIPARASYTRSHLDVHYPLAAARLTVRRAGLDIDPGWLPWLGQVVRFHYQDLEAAV